MLLGAWLRFHALVFDARLHPDEALYSTFARDAALQGRWLLPGLLDKPPLALYASALSLHFVGVNVNAAGVLDILTVRVGELAVRLPNTLASLVLIAVVGAAARRIYRDRRTALWAMALVALSPFSVAFSATAFTDVLLVLCGSAAFWMSVRGNGAAAGIGLALALASKQAGLLYMPLLMAAGWLAGWAWRRWLGFVGMFALGVGLLLAWDGARGGPSIWQVSGARENYPAGLVSPDMLLPRLQVWAGYGQWLFGGSALTLLLVVAGGWRVVYQPRMERFSRLLLLYAGAYGLAHGLADFNTFDRYLLPLVPLLALLCAYGLSGWRHGQVGVLLVGLMLPAAWAASEQRLNIGGDLGQHTGIDQLAFFLNSQPVATVVYDHWLGWELGYYMGAWSDKRRVYYPTPQALAQDALRLKEQGVRYFPAPRDAPIDAWLAALEKAGFAVERVYAQERFIVYAIIPPPADSDVLDAESSLPGREYAGDAEWFPLRAGRGWFFALHQ